MTLRERLPFVCAQWYASQPKCGAVYLNSWSLHWEKDGPVKVIDGEVEGQTCAGCGVPLSDGYVIGCDHCSNRRQRRLKRGELFTPTCFAGEMIDNRTGRIVASA